VGPRSTRFRPPRQREQRTRAVQTPLQDSLRSLASNRPALRSSKVIHATGVTEGRGLEELSERVRPHRSETPCSPHSTPASPKKYSPSSTASASAPSNAWSTAPRTAPKPPPTASPPANARTSQAPFTPAATRSTTSPAGTASASAPSNASSAVNPQTNESKRNRRTLSFSPGEELKDKPPEVNSYGPTSDAKQRPDVMDGLGRMYLGEGEHGDRLMRGRQRGRPPARRCRAAPMQGSCRADDARRRLPQHAPLTFDGSH